MKSVVTLTFRGVEVAVSENMDYVFGVLDPTILDETNIDIKVFTEEGIEI